MLGYLLAVAALVCIVKYIRKTIAIPKNYPPGPPRWPIFGNLLTLVRRKSFQDVFRVWTKKYGKVFSFKYGELDFVGIVDPRIAKEVFSKDAASGRPNFYCVDFYRYFKNVGLIFSENQPWKENRRFVLRNCWRDFGFGKKSLETLILDEMEELVAVIWPKEEAGKEKPAYRDVQLDASLNAAVTNVIWWLMACKRVTGKDQDFTQVLELIESLVDFQMAAFFSFLPSWIPYVPDWVLGVPKMKRHREHMLSYMQAIVDEHRQTLVPEEPRDLIDCYLVEMDRRKLDMMEERVEEVQHEDPFFHEEMLLSAMMDMFMAGVETTSTTLRWTFLLMALYPEVQAKVHAEIDCVVGKDRVPSFDDKVNMPYTDAVTNEIWRYVTIAPDGGHRKALVDMNIGGYRVPKGTHLAAQIFLIHHDPDLWEAPGKFKPERFIGPDGLLLKKEALMPFGVGKRQCLGESLARMNTFLGIVYLMQLFTFEQIPGEEYSDEPKKSSVALHLPQPYRVRIRSRL